MTEFIGPVLPPQNKKDVDIDPVLPPLHLNKSESEEEQSLEALNESKEIGPSLSSQKPVEKERASCYGPALPPHLQKDPASGEIAVEGGPENDSYGPALPPRLHSDQDSDEEVYGPLPPGATLSTQAQQALEERALKIKIGHLDGTNEKPPGREEWMTELPDVQRKNLGLGPRQFRKNAMPDYSDRSSWTDTPQDKANKKGKKEEKVDLKKESERKELLKRDEEQQKMADTHSKTKKRNKSLLELHQAQQEKKKKKSEEEGITRRPFSRDVDLQVNRFDEAQKKSILKKAMHLDDRFSAGQSKFL